MSNCITYKNAIPKYGVYMGKAFRFNKVSAGKSRFAYAGSVEINNDNFQIIHDASINIVVFRNNENKIYEKYNIKCKLGMQDMLQINQ
jgi:hypothetical protein